MTPAFQAALSPLSLAARTYRIQTDTVTTVKEQTVRNAITTTLRQSPYGQNSVIVEQLAFTQSDRSPLAGLLNELNPINQRLVFDLSPYGDLLGLRNKAQLEERWQQLKPALWAKYARSRDGLTFLQAFEQQLYGPALMAHFSHKGPYGVLLPALFGPTGQVREGLSSRLMTGFFGSLDLPLLLHTTVVPSPTLPGGRELQVTARPDPARLEADKLKALAKQAMDLPNFEVVYRIEGQETYLLAADHTLVSSTQKLTAVIENFYHHYTQHTLTLLPNDGRR